MQKMEDAQAEQDDDDNDNPHGGMKSDENPLTKQEDELELDNEGKLLIDATCAPADIAFSTDLRLLNDAWEKLKDIIDTLHTGLIRESSLNHGPIRKKARKAYLSVAKQRNPRRKTLRKAIGKQLNFVKRDLIHIEELAEQRGMISLSKTHYRQLLVIQELYRQQKFMYETKTHQVNVWIVSISKPHILPIVLGKADATEEFGSKISVNMVDGFVLVDKLDWNAYNEGK